VVSNSLTRPLRLSWKFEKVKFVAGKIVRVGLVLNVQKRNRAIPSGTNLMKSILFFLSVLVSLYGCESKEQKIAAVDAAFEKAQSLPASQVCENEAAYRGLANLEKEKGTAIYTEVTAQKIASYAQKCTEHLLNIAEQRERKAKEYAKALAEKRLNERLSKVKDNMHILGYTVDGEIASADCRNFILRESFLGDSYYCEYRRSPSDIIQFHSDPYTKIVGKIFRFTLIDREQAQAVKEKVIERYGRPKVENFKEGDWVHKWQAAWGEVEMNYQEIVQDIVFESKPYTKSVRFYFDSCEGNFGACKDIFGVSNDPSRVIGRTYLFGRQSTLNSSALSMKKDPRNKEKPKQIDTQGADELDI
jgi:hypothetical protein